MSQQRSLDSFGAYQQAMKLFDLVVDDMEEVRRDQRCFKLVSQQVAAADSVCANIEEGFGREIGILTSTIGTLRRSEGR